MPQPVVPPSVPRRYIWAGASKPSTRLTINQALHVVGVADRIAFTEKTLIRFGRQASVTNHHYKRGGFWERHTPEELAEIFRVAEVAFRRRLKTVGHDFIENHDEAAALIGAWGQVKRLMARHGVEIAEA